MPNNLKLLDAIPHIRLSELNFEIQRTVDDAFSKRFYWVIADITNHSFKEGNNYHFFDLVEKIPGTTDIAAKISGKAWGNGSSRIREFERLTGQQFTNNINVLVQVKVNFHPVYGLAVDILNIDPNFTIGLLEQQRQETLRLLVEKNPAVIQKVGDTYQTRNKSLPLPTVIQKVAVVSSKSSAGKQDFEHTLANNSFGYKFQIDEYNTIVQNEANALVLRQTMVDIFNAKKHYDVVVIIRGGGAQTDFLIFDNYDTGLVVAKFPIPVITGIGHQKNETIADLMAHTTTKTPTKAAEFIISHNRRFEDEISSLQKAIIIKPQQLLSNSFQRLSTVNSTVVNKSRTFLNDYKDNLVSINQVVVNQTKSILFNRYILLNQVASSLVTKPRIFSANKINDLENIQRNLKVFVIKYSRNQQGYLAHYASMIRMMSPDNILRKGFAIVKQNGVITSNATQFKPGTDIEVILSFRSIISTVKTNLDYNGNDFNI